MTLWKGLITALITPFREDFSLDEKGLEKNIDDQMEALVDGLLVLGTTGETPTLNRQEKDRVIQIAIQKTGKKIPIMVGCGSNSTQETIENIKRAENLGADAALVVTPYYNKPTQEGIFLHFEEISRKTSFPIFVYNIPARTGLNIELITMERICKLPSIIGIKESSGKMEQAITYLKLLQTSSISLFAGDDILSFFTLSLGGKGVISVASNLIPKEMKTLIDLLLQKDLEEAKFLFLELVPLFQSLFVETNPAPIKYAMKWKEKPAGPCRLPLAPLKKENQDFLLFILEKWKNSLTVV